MWDRPGGDRSDRWGRAQSLSPVPIRAEHPFDERAKDVGKGLAQRAGLALGVHADQKLIDAVCDLVPKRVEGGEVDRILAYQEAPLLAVPSQFVVQADIGHRRLQFKARDAEGLSEVEVAESHTPMRAHAGRGDWGNAASGLVKSCALPKAKRSGSGPIGSGAADMSRVLIVSVSNR